MLIVGDHASKLRLACLAVIRANLVTEKWTGRCLVACLGRHGAVRAALHTPNSAVLSRGPCGIVMHGLDGERQAATAKSLPRVTMLQSAASIGRLGLKLPCGRGPARHCFAAGLPSEAGCDKGEDRTAVSAVVIVDGGSPCLPRWDAADITADGREAATWSKGCVSVVYGAADING